MMFEGGATSGGRAESAPYSEKAIFHPATQRIHVRISFCSELSQSLKDSARHQLWSWSAFRSAVASEFGSLRPSIQMMYRTKLHRHGSFLGLAGRISPTGCQTSCAATFARIADMKCMLANHPRATGWDQQMILEGWEMGAQWAAYAVGSPERRKGNTAETALEDYERPERRSRRKG